MKSRKIVDRTDGYEPTLNQPWVISGRPGCIRFDYESQREKIFGYLLLAGIVLLFFGTLGFEPKRFHYANPLHTAFKLRLMIGAIMTGLSAAFLRGKRVILQIVAAIACCVPFFLAFQLYKTHGAVIIPQEYFFPSWVKLGSFLIVLSALQLFFTDDYLIFDPDRHLVIEHTQYLFVQRERPLCSFDKVSRVEVQERRVTNKGTTTVYIKAAVTLANSQTYTCMHEVSLGKTDNIEFGTEADQIIALAVAIAGACASRVHYPPIIIPGRQRQP